MTSPATVPVASGHPLERGGRGAPESARLRKVVQRFAIVVAVTTTVIVPLVAADRIWQVGAGVALLVGVWWGFFRALRRWPGLQALPLGVALGAGTFVVCAENLLWLEARLEFRVSHKLHVGERLTAYMDEHAVYRPDVFEPYGADPLFYRRKPGSRHLGFLDVDPKNVYETRADEIGYLNRDRGFYADGRPIAAFVAGDSVIQGVGMPSVTDVMRERSGLRVFNLATGGYGPTDRVEALKLFAIPRRPQWVVVEFFSGNDINDAIESDVCRWLRRNYRCRFARLEIRRGLSRHPRYRALGEFAPHESTDRSMGLLRDVRGESLTLALGSYMARAVKMRVDDLRAGRGRAAIASAEGPAGGEAIAAVPGGERYLVRPDRRREWFEAGFGVATAAYDDLVRQARGAGIGVAVVYNPTSQEIYAEAPLPSATGETVSWMQRQALRGYAAERGVAFCDLTDGFRARVRDGARGLYGRRDDGHWSRHGTEVAASVLLECFDAIGAR